MGEEFKSSHELLESELQRTHVELSSLLDKFKRSELSGGNSLVVRAFDCRSRGHRLITVALYEKSGLN